MKVICVLKTGGPYDSVYVLRLKNAVERYLTIPHEFICLTDDPFVEKVSTCTVIPLKHNWPGWWSKIELFRPDLPKDDYLYFDLDTVLIGSLDLLAELMVRHKFAMLRGFNRRFKNNGHPASGVMTGRFPELSHIYEEFKKDPKKCIEETKSRGRVGAGMEGDQGFIIRMVGENILKIQDYLPEELIAGKYQVDREKWLLPNNASIIAWSGKPRLHSFTGGNLLKAWKGEDFKKER